MKTISFIFCGPKQLPYWLHLFLFYLRLGLLTFGLIYIEKVRGKIFVKLIFVPEFYMPKFVYFNWKIG